MGKNKKNKKNQQTQDSNNTPGSSQTDAGVQMNTQQP